MTLERSIAALHSGGMYARDAASIATPIGLVRVTGTGDRIDAIDIGVEDGSTSDAPAILEALRQIEAYFAGRLTEFDLPLALSPTPRGADLRQAIVDIAYGETASYGALAKAIGSSLSMKSKQSLIMLSCDVNISTSLSGKTILPRKTLGNLCRT